MKKFFNFIIALFLATLASFVVGFGICAVGVFNRSYLQMLIVLSASQDRMLVFVMTLIKMLSNNSPAPPNRPQSKQNPDSESE